jgi:hypothetical protein
LYFSTLALPPNTDFAAHNAGISPLQTQLVSPRW